MATIKYGTATSARVLSGTGAVALLRDGSVIGAFHGKDGLFGFGYTPDKRKPQA